MSFLDTIDSFKASLVVTGDVDVISIVTEGCPLLTVIAQSSRQRINGAYTGMGMRERFWTRGYTFFFKEVGDYPEYFTVNGGINSSATTLVVDDTDGLVKGSVLLNPTSGEMIRVSATVASATDVTITRAFGTVVAASVADDEVLYLISVSTDFGAVGTNEVNKEAVEQTNYFEKITTTFTRDDLENFSVDPLYEMKWENAQKVADMFVNDKLIEHAKQIEKSLLFSQKKWDSVNKIGKMEGLIRLAIRGGINEDISTAPTLSNFIDTVKETYKAGSSTIKYALVGEDCESVLMNMIEAYKIENHGIANYALDGVNLTFKEIILPAGQIIRLIRHPYMTTESGYGGHVLIIDPTQLELVYMKGRDAEGRPVDGMTRLEKVTSESNYATQQFDIVTYISLKNANASSHGLVQLV